MKPASEFDYLEYEERGSVGIWSMEDFASYYNSGEIQDGEEHYREHASEDEMNATVLVLDNSGNLGTEVRNSLEHINEKWSELANDVGVDRVAFVADGMMGSALKANVDTDTEMQSFDGVDEAVEWCQQA
ncbi:hypothetical protein [Halobiforma nitratireducens]|uniref:STAS/SEC14 domain-containing protein n=1 Tax=Halobiforma nitratireducens JCM 10879 TaxID=1227454 RepID=M0LW75_9EURY|nr:hypothetical protein [Halobiforma nitratireducens]EMA36350.1 hypothetical protein C446_11852 [Halobiforma nitratireducens JCM 10879]